MTAPPSPAPRALIRQREVVADEWMLADGEPATRHRALILPFARWHAEREHWWLWAGKLGVRIAPADRVELLAPDLKRLSLVAVEFPGPSEGRGYSQARVLRDRFRFTGEVRAVGHVKRDQLFFMARCGFDAFELSPGEDPRACLAALDDFAVAYQPASDRLTGVRVRPAAGLLQPTSDSQAD